MAALGQSSSSGCFHIPYCRRPISSSIGTKAELAYLVCLFVNSRPCRATHVPVGQDQQQHLEFARECVTNFNHAYGPHLVYPETITCRATSIMQEYFDITQLIMFHSTGTPSYVTGRAYFQNVQITPT